MCTNWSFSRTSRNYKRPPKMLSLGGHSLTRVKPILDPLGQNFASLSYDNCRDFLHVLNVLLIWKVNCRKIRYFPLRYFCLLYYPGTVTILTIDFCPSRASLQKTKENFKLWALKVVVVAYERWSLTRSSQYSDFRKLLVFWRTSSLGEVVDFRKAWLVIHVGNFLVTKSILKCK